MGNCCSFEDEKSQQHVPPPMTRPVATGHGVGISPINATFPKTLNASESHNIKSASSILVITKNVKDLRKNPGNSDLDIFTYEEMRLATRQFRPDQVLGEGGFGIVYKGVIDENVRVGYKKTPVAIKELDREGLQGDREWLAEVNYLGQLRHQNLVKLIGYCCENDHRLLVYEYMASGSLEKHLFRRVCDTLTWSRRMKIALDAAKGLAFLHGAESSIIYRDFKTSNILLDAMLIGRRAMDKSRPSREHNLVEWARPLLKHNKKVLRIFDPRMEGQYSSRTATKVANLAYQCLSQNPKGRPLMSQVVEILESLQTHESSQDEAMLRRGGGSLTLYECPKGVPETPTGDKKCPIRSESEREEQMPRRKKPANGRSKSEPPTQFDLYGPSPDVAPGERS
ncbi:hypothetical protein RJ640_016941 [Escallonia rubra]|uniref:non-specific serine/threonine protein kinase n=1 Tax=Escallonia rubra TaxID=112253 RepID=A0AA88RWM4_9ASTE|nr:hypothetical protein RJ640_016941 [Escallonia rubra]